jgi:c-di-GMP-binding flagellar brake protein YcgR
VNTAQIYETQTGIAQSERRKYPRAQAAIPIEFKAEGAAVATHAQTADISLGGCYVEMNFTLAVGSKLEIALWLGDDKVTAQAIVATHHPYFGNGIQFINMSAEDESKLKKFVSSVIH